ncbi:MAG TPA: AroM family protein, partial [Stellaceae bacterium]|nr:AroM family protein [Stellaceae bacterium]
AKWRPLARTPLFAAVSPYGDGPEAVLATGEQLQAEGAEAVLLDCIGFTEVRAARRDHTDPIAARCSTRRAARCCSSSGRR